MKSMILMFAIATAILLSGCKYVLNEDDPVSVARAFWTAALSSTPADAKPFMVNGEKLAIGIKGQSDQDTAVLGKVDEQDGNHFIQTTLQLARDGKTVSVPMRTVVVSADGVWRVDYWSTKQSVFDAIFETSMKWFASTMGNADSFVEDILGAENQEETLQYAEERLTEEFARVKESILKNYKVKLDLQAKQQQINSAQPAG